MGKLFGCFRQLVGNSRQLVVCGRAPLFSFSKNKSLILSLCYQQGARKNLQRLSAQSAKDSLQPSNPSESSCLSPLQVLVLISGAVCCEQGFRDIQLMQSSLPSLLFKCNAYRRQEKRESKTPHFLIWGVGATPQVFNLACCQQKDTKLCT